MAILTSSLSRGVLAKVVDCTTSAQIWSSLHSLFSASSSAQIMQTRLQLTTLKKGADSISVYFDRTKSLSAKLSAAGQVLSPPEFASYLFGGLGPEYDPVITSLSTLPTLPDSTAILSHLLTHESRLSLQTQNLQNSVSVNASMTTTQPPEANFTSHNGRGRGTNNFNTGRGRQHHNNRGRGGRGNRAPNPTFFTGAPDHRPVCQVCGRPGHTALKCWHRFDHAFQAAPPPNFQANSTSSWFPDTAATHHFTPDLSNLRIDHLPYEGSESVSLGDGSQIPILHHGNGLLPTPQHQGNASSGPR